MHIFILSHVVLRSLVGLVGGCLYLCGNVLARRQPAGPSIVGWDWGTDDCAVGDEQVAQDQY